MITHVSDWVTNTTGSNGHSLSGSSPQGALIVVSLLTANPSTPVVTDNAGNTYTFIASDFGGSNNTTVYMYYAKNANAASVISASASGGSATMMGATILAGADPTNPLVSSNHQSNDSMLNPPACTVAGVAGGAVVGCIGVGVSSRVLTIENDYTEFMNYRASSRNLAIARKLTSASGNTAPDWAITSGSATSTYEVTAAFKPAGSTPSIAWEYWSGSTLQPLTLEGYWNGSSVVPFTPQAVEQV